MSVFYGLKTENITDPNFFVEFYSNLYFYLNDFDTEKRVQDIIYADHKRTPDEIISFLKWKVGDKSNDNSIVTQYGRTIETDKIIELAEEIDSTWEMLNPEDIYDKIVHKNIKNLGAVYTLSLVFLIKKGEEPIYDKFAETAIDVILDESHRFREPYKYTELPDKNDVPVVMNRYKEYKAKLEKVFGDQWKKDRDIDRALWTYGHLFSGKNVN